MAGRWPCFRRPWTHVSRRSRASEPSIEPRLAFLGSAPFLSPSGPSPTGGAAFHPGETGPVARPRHAAPRWLGGRTIPLNEGDADIGSREGDIVSGDDPYLSRATRGSRVGQGPTRCATSTAPAASTSVCVMSRSCMIGIWFFSVSRCYDSSSFWTASYPGASMAGRGAGLRHPRGFTVRAARPVHNRGRRTGRALPFRDETVIGRENGDIVFTDDPFLSRRHAAIRIDHAGHRFTLHDLGSSNGTALRIRGEHVLTGRGPVPDWQAPVPLQKQLALPREAALSDERRAARGDAGKGSNAKCGL